MNFFKNFFNRVFGKTCVFGTGKMAKMKIVLRAEYKIATPTDAMPLLATALVFQTKKAASVSYQKLEALNIYSPETKEYQGCCYALKFDVMYIGALIGTEKIFSCKVRDWHFEKTRKILVPLTDYPEDRYDLVCQLDEDNQALLPLEIQKTHKETGEHSNNMVFAATNTFNDALRYCFEQGLLEK